MMSHRISENVRTYVRNLSNIWIGSPESVKRFLRIFSWISTRCFGNLYWLPSLRTTIICANSDLRSQLLIALETDLRCLLSYGNEVDGQGCVARLHCCHDFAFLLTEPRQWRHVSEDPTKSQKHKTTCARDLYTEKLLKKFISRFDKIWLICSSLSLTI